MIQFSEKIRRKTRFQPTYHNFDLCCETVIHQETGNCVVMLLTILPVDEEEENVER